MAREVIRCPHCALNQFFTRSGDCRKCEQPLTIREETPEPISLPVIRVHTLSTSSACIPKIGHLLGVLRQARGLSQRELGEKLGKPRTWFTKMEQGKNTPTIESLEKCCAALNVTPYVIIALAEAAP